MTIQDILAQINHERDALLTGGALAPDSTDAAGVTVQTGNGTGGAQAPDAAAAADKLAKALATLRQNGAGTAHGIPGLKKFGGDILGYGQHQDADPGHSGSFAIVKRGGKLFHLFDDGSKMKIDEGAVARALGIKPKVAQIVGAPQAPDPFGAFAAGQAGNGTGGAMAPADASAPRGQDPFGDLRRLLHRRA